MSVRQDVEFSLKMMRRSPRVSLTVLLTLALGIGANTAIFSIVNAALLRPLPFQQPGQLVQLNADERGIGSQNLGFSYPELQDLRDRAGIFDGVSVTWQVPANLTGGDHPERVEALASSPNYFSILGSHPQLGRLFDSRDVADGFAEAAVISDSYWHSEFGGSPNILGRRIRLDNDLYTIVGVLPASFNPPTASVAGPVDVWITAGYRANPFPPPTRSTRFLPALIARLKPGITIQQAQASLATFSSSLRHDYADDYPAGSGWTTTLTPLKSVVVGNSRTLLVSLMLAVGFILLIACVNVANLLLASASARQREISIRMALGADRGRIVRQFLTESVILSLMAAIVGTNAATASLRFLVAVLPSQLPHVNAISVDGRVLVFSLATALLTTLLFGLVPALEASKAAPDTTDLTSRNISASSHETRLRKILIGAEVALSLMLLVGAGLLLRTFWSLLHVDPGFQPGHLITANIWLPVPNDPAKDYYIKPEQRALLVRETLRRLQAVPGVKSVAASRTVPLQRPLLPVGFTVEGAPQQVTTPAAVPAFITPDFFATLRAPLVSGRPIQDSDNTQTSRVVLVDEAAAHRFWGDRDPIGRRIRFSRDFVVNGKPQPGPWMTVVGVVSNVKLSSLDEHNVPHVYAAMYQFPDRQFGVLVRATGDKAALGRAIQREIQSVDPNLPVSHVSEMKEIINTGVGGQRFAAWLLAVFAAVALVLTSVGIYGVTSYAITSRTREFGIRTALGASPANIVRTVLLHGMSPILIGVLVGAVGAILSGRLIASMLYSVQPADTAVLAVAVATVVIIGIAANYIPARRAARIDPIVALRTE